MAKNIEEFLNITIGGGSLYDRLQEGAITVDDLNTIKHLAEIEKILEEKTKKYELLKLILLISIVLTIWVMVLITFNYKWQLKIPDKIIVILTSGVVTAIVAYLRTIVRYYWNRKK